MSRATNEEWVRYYETAQATTARRPGCAAHVPGAEADARASVLHRVEPSLGRRSHGLLFDPRDVNTIERPAGGA